MLKLAAIFGVLASGASAAVLELSFTGEGITSEVLTFEAASASNITYSADISDTDLTGVFGETGATILSWQTQFPTMEFIGFSFTTDQAGNVTDVFGGGLISDFSDALFFTDRIELASSNPAFGTNFTTAGDWVISEIAEVPLPASGLLLLAGLGWLRVRR